MLTMWTALSLMTSCFADGDVMMMMMMMMMMNCTWTMKIAPKSMVSKAKRDMLSNKDQYHNDHKHHHYHCNDHNHHDHHDYHQQC